MKEPHRKGRPRGGTGGKYRYNPTKVWRRMMAALTKAGGEAITMYGMRHTLGTVEVRRVIFPARCSLMDATESRRSVMTRQGAAQAGHKKRPEAPVFYCDSALAEGRLLGLAPGGGMQITRLDTDGYGQRTFGDIRG